MDLIISAKERQAAEANKAANNLLKEIESEKSREQTKKEAAAKKREKRKAKKKGKQQPTTTTEEELPPPPRSPTPPLKVEEEVVVPPSSTIEIEEHIETPSINIVVVEEDDLRLKMVINETEQKPVSPERTTKQPINNNNKKKTNTMTRKMERHQENLVSKTKQESTNIDDGWQEVIGKQKKITIPHEQYSRVVGRSGSNLNVLREVTGASIDIENKRAIGDKTILIKYKNINFCFFFLL